MISHPSGEDRAGVSEALEFAGTLGSAAGAVTNYRQRCALIPYFGLGGDGAWTLRAIADGLGASREAVRQSRDRAIDDLVFRGTPDRADAIGIALVEQARRALSMPTSSA